jgi:hypothetical protein
MNSAAAAVVVIVLMSVASDWVVMATDDVSVTPKRTPPSKAR